VYFCRSSCEGVLAVMPCQLKLHALLINSSSLVNDASVSPADSSLTSHSIAACINQYRVRSVWPSPLGSVRSNSYSLELKGKGSPYSISERRVLELIPVLGSLQVTWVINPAVGCNYFPQPRPAFTVATLKRAATSFAAWWTEAWWVSAVCLRLLPDSVAAAIWTQALLRLSPAR